jgi:uncharacterized repeat protein (TIGR04138 family)
MRVSHFDQAVKNICAKNSRIDKGAYDFLREALDYTSEKSKKEGTGSNHVSAAELLEGIKEFALKEFGPMAATLFQEWNVRYCADIGEMVFSLIDEGIFSKQESDRREDFCEIFDFQQAFVYPFLPKHKIPLQSQS